MRREDLWQGTARIAVIAALAVFAGSCGRKDSAPAAAGDLLIVARVPAGETRLHPEPGWRIPAGSQLVALELDGAEPGLRELSTGLEAAGRPSVTIDGRRVLFIGREGDSERFSLFISAIDGSGRRRLTGESLDCAGAAELPDGRIALAARLEDGSPPPGFGSAWGLFVLSPEAGEVERITFTGQTELDPHVLADGRILYSQWLPGGDGRSESGSFALFTVHPDGTGAAPLHGHHRGPEWKLRPRQGEDGDLFFVMASPGGPGRVAGTSWTAPAIGGFELPATGAPVLAVEPVSGDRLLVAAGPSAGEPGGLLLLDGEGTLVERLPFFDPEWEVVEAVEVRARRRPQGQLSMIDPAGDRGHLLAIDARPEGPLGARAVSARLRLAGSAEEPPRVLGEVELAEDGSFFASVPADRPLLLEILDADGESLVETVTPFWVRPKEIRGCVGCHEDPETAPPNRRPLAVLGDPVDLADPAERRAGG